jgi:Leucine-rich repeat (LRR) protein
LNYQGIELEEEEVKVLEELEKLIGEKIPPVEKIDLEAFGFKAEEGKITELGIYKKGMTHLPDNFCKLTNLKHLKLEMNEIEALPEEIGELTQLETLELWTNKLTKLPDSMGQLSNLKYLDLKSNLLEALPESLYNLENLVKLDLWRNKLESLSSKIGGLKKLEYLNLYDNLLETIPEEIGDLENIIEINLTGNNWVSIPKKARVKICLIRDWKWKKLEEDDLGVIQELSVIIGLKIPKVKKLKKDTLGYKEKKGKVEELGLSNSWLKVLPDSIEKLVRLKHLYLVSNSLTTLPKAIEKLVKLKEIDLTGNHFLEELPEETVQKLEEQGCKIIL